MAPIPDDRVGGSSAAAEPLEASTEHFVPASGFVAPRGPLWRVVDAAILLGVAGMVVIVGVQVVSRTLASPVAWTEELTRYLFIYTAFLGMGAGFRHAEHARIAFLIARLPRLAQRVGVHLYVVAGIVFFAVVAVKGWDLTTQQFRSGETSPALGVGMYLVTAPIVIGAVLAVIAHIQSVYRSPDLRERLERGEMTAA